MRKRRFVIRTIKNGQVKINGKMFEPTAKWLEYDGCLDGQRWAFGLYWNGDKMLPFVKLWGTEKAYQAFQDGEIRDLPPDMIYSADLKNWWATWVTEIAKHKE